MKWESQCRLRNCRLGLDRPYFLKTSWNEECFQVCLPILTRIHWHFWHFLAWQPLELAPRIPFGQTSRMKTSSAWSISRSVLIMAGMPQWYLLPSDHAWWKSSSLTIALFGSPWSYSFSPAKSFHQNLWSYSWSWSVFHFSWCWDSLTLLVHTSILWRVDLNVGLGELTRYSFSRCCVVLPGSRSWMAFLLQQPWIELMQQVSWQTSNPASYCQWPHQAISSGLCHLPLNSCILTLWTDHPSTGSICHFCCLFRFCSFWIWPRHDWRLKSWLASVYIYWCYAANLLYLCCSMWVWSWYVLLVLDTLNFTVSYW